MLLWRHSTGTVIAGSIHVLPADRLIPPELTRAYEESSALVLECKYDECDPAVNLLPEGRNLGEFVKPRTYRQLRSAAKTLQMNLVEMRALQPWACAQAIASRAWERSGFAFQHGIDAHFYQRAENEGKTVYQLEEPRTVAALLGSLALELQDEYLFRTLNELHLIPDRIARMIKAWQNDDLVAIDAIQRQLPRAIYERLFVQRNTWWTQSVIKGVREAPNALVLVGCGHLVGKDSLVRMLETEAIGFERVRG